MNTETKPPVRASDWLRELDEDDGREQPPDVFADRYPPIRDVPTLRLALEDLLTNEQHEKLAGWAIPHPATGVFDGLAYWARVERAHNDAPTRAPIAGMYIPARLAMPPALADLLGVQVKGKRGARPLSNPKARKVKA